MTISDGNFIKRVLSRNKQAPQWGVAPIEDADDTFRDEEETA